MSIDERYKIGNILGVGTFGKVRSNKYFLNL